MPKKKKVKRKKRPEKEKRGVSETRGFRHSNFLFFNLWILSLSITLSTISTLSNSLYYFLHNTLYNTLTLPCHVPFGKLDLCCLHLFTSNLRSSLPFDLEVARTSKLYNETVSR